MTTVKPLTVDNMGVGPSSRYARDIEKAALGKTLIEDSRYIPQKTEVSVAKPYLPTEFDQYLGLNQQTLWALFSPPPDGFSNATLFSYQLMPRLGSPEKQEADTDKLEALEDTLNKSKQGNEQREEKERKTLLSLLKMIRKLDRTLSLINARRNQYQRG